MDRSAGNAACPGIFGNFGRFGIFPYPREFQGVKYPLYAPNLGFRWHSPRSAPSSIAGAPALGLVIPFASRTILPGQLYPWLSLGSGLLVAALGLTILRQRLLGRPAFGRHHEHPRDHSHLHDHHHHHDHADAHAHAHGIAHTHPHDGHTHSHLPPGADGNQLTWRKLPALGVSGGLLPCPSALLALLGAVDVGRAGFGALVVIAFSLGLAAI